MEPATASRAQALLNDAARCAQPFALAVFSRNETKRKKGYFKPEAQYIWLLESQAISKIN